MKTTRTIIILSVALISGLLAAVLAARWLDKQSQNDITQIVVARTEINLGQRVVPEMVKLVDWPKNSLPQGAYTSIEKLDGRVLKAALQRGEPVLEAKLAPQGTQGGLSAVISEGKRAITVRVNDVIGVAGFALPGNYVDIIVNTQKESNKTNQTNQDQTISKIVLEKILVLAVAQEVSRDETRPRVVNAVTLEVSPEEAEKIDLARSVGSLSLVLRNQVDPHPIRTGGITKSELLSIQKNSAKNEVEKEPKKVEKKISEKIAQIKSIKQNQVTNINIKNTIATEKQNNEVKNIPRMVAKECVGVINGVQNSIECY
ncbi:MAG: Flp pilus assembly protein CpaB [bacterium]